MMGRTTMGIFLSALFVCLHSASVLAQNVLVVYYSEGGHTQAMAEAVARGARAASDGEVRLLSVDETSADDLPWADAVIVGTPVYAANVAAPVQEFLSHWPWEGGMKDKIGAAFVTGGGISAGEELVQLNILHSMLIYNMIVVGGPTWTEAFGASTVTLEEPFTDTREEPWIDPRFLAKGVALGERVAQLAARLEGGD